jgi:hypothetical protein
MKAGAPRDIGRRTAWAAGLTVGLGASVATAHGLYQVAAAAYVPAPIAWLYPLITDGLALVAYGATSRLQDGGRRYAAAIVVLAAGLSGLAQAIYLAGGLSAQATAPTACGSASAPGQLLPPRSLLISSTSSAVDHQARANRDRPIRPIREPRRPMKPSKRLCRLHVRPALSKPT